MPPRRRLDVVLVERGLAETRERAQSLILSGAVLVDDRPVGRPAQAVPDEARVSVTPSVPDYVSRGALKLEAALDAWRIDPTGAIAVDVGASTGGFTDMLLRRGASRVYAVDVGYGQLHYKLRQDPRVVSIERTNIRHLERLPQQAQLAVVDVSFIGLRIVLPHVWRLTRTDGVVIALIKPQFEAGRAQVRKGVVRNAGVHEQVLRELREWSQNQPWRMVETLPSPIKGPAGNQEFLSLWRPA